MEPAQQINLAMFNQIQYDVQIRIHKIGTVDFDIDATVIGI